MIRYKAATWTVSWAKECVESNERPTKLDVEVGLLPLDMHGQRQYGTTRKSRGFFYLI